MDFSYFYANESDVFAALGQHVRLTVITLIIAIAIAVPIGTLIARVPLLYTPVLGVLGVI